jgi:hypothetical protein
VTEQAGYTHPITISESVVKPRHLLVALATLGITAMSHAAVSPVLT